MQFTQELIQTFLNRNQRIVEATSWLRTPTDEGFNNKQIFKVCAFHQFAAKTVINEKNELIHSTIAIVEEILTGKLIEKNIENIRFLNDIEIVNLYSEQQVLL